MMAQIIKFVLGGKANPKETEPIAAQPLKFPGMAGLGSALIALAGVALGVAKLLGWVHPRHAVDGGSRVRCGWNDRIRHCLRWRRHCPRVCQRLGRAEQEGGQRYRSRWLGHD